MNKLLVVTLSAAAAWRAVPVPAAGAYAVLRTEGRSVVATDRIRLLAEPKSDGKVIGEYDRGARLNIIGQAQGTDYVYVSPCESCGNGFVQKREIQVKSRAQP